MASAIADFKAYQRPCFRNLPRNFMLNEGNDITIVDFFLLICQHFKFVKDLLQLFR